MNSRECPLKVLLYQYVLFKGSYYHKNALKAFDKLKRGKIPLQSDEYLFIYRDLLFSELFDSISDDLVSLLDYYDCNYTK